MASSKPPLNLGRGKNYHSKKSQPTVYIPVNPTALPVNPVPSSAPVVTIHSAGTSFAPKSRLELKAVTLTWSHRT